MTHGPTRIPSKGACIYCHRSGVRLTDEHILPLSLGGSHVIEKASCDDCAKITSKFEGKVARDLWGHARNSYGAPSQRKKKRPAVYTFDDIANPGRKISIPFNEYPAGMVFYLMHPAGALIGAHPSHDQSKIWQLRAVMDDQRVRAFEAKYPGRHPRLSVAAREGQNSTVTRCDLRTRPKRSMPSSRRPVLSTARTMCRCGTASWI